MVSGNPPGLPRNDDVIARSEAVPRHALFGKLRRRGAFNNPQLCLPLFRPWPPPS